MIIPHSRARRAAFSLVELLVVMGILAIVMGLTVVGSKVALTNAAENKARQQLKTLELGLESYYNDNGGYPESEDGSEDLYVALTGDADQNGQLSEEEQKSGLYLEELLSPGGKKSLQDWVNRSGGRATITDPWDAEYQYRAPGEQNALYDLWSYGTDAEQLPENEAKWIKNW